MRILKRTAILIITVFVLILPLANQVNAVSSFSQIQSQASSWLQQGSQNQQISQQTIKDNLLPIANILVGVATIIFVIVGSIMGVKYMLAGADEKANLKQKLIWFVISMVVVYGAVGIFNLIVSVMNSIV